MSKYIEYQVKVYEDRTEWYLNGQLHRENGPAIEHLNGDKFWYLNGKLHRVGNPARELANGDKFWYINGNLHREDGPAKEYGSGAKFWYLNGRLHVADGPAYDYANGNKRWFFNDKECTETEYLKLTQKATQSPTCEGKVVEIDGKKYKLVSL